MSENNVIDKTVKADQVRTMVSTLSPRAVGFSEFIEEAEKDEKQRAEKARRLREMISGSARGLDGPSTAPLPPRAPKPATSPVQEDPVSPLSSSSKPQLLRRHSDDSGSSRERERVPAPARRPAEIHSSEPTVHEVEDPRVATSPINNEVQNRAEKAQKLRAMIKAVSPRATGVGIIENPPPSFSAVPNWSGSDDDAESNEDLQARFVSAERIRGMVKALSPRARGLISESSEKEYVVEMLSKENDNLLVTTRSVGGKMRLEATRTAGERLSVSSSGEDSSPGLNATSQASLSEKAEEC
jgi:hypothetical protein